MVDIKKEVEPGRQVQGEPEIKAGREGMQPEVESWVTKIEKKLARVPNQTQDVTDDSVVIQSPQAAQPPVTLPITQQQMQIGKKAKPELGIAWLVTWAIRQIKKLTRIGRKVRLQDLPEAK